MVDLVDASQSSRRWWWLFVSCCLTILPTAVVSSFQGHLVVLHSALQYHDDRRYNKNVDNNRSQARCWTTKARTTTTSTTITTSSGMDNNNSYNNNSNVVAIDAATGERKFMYMTAEQDELLRRKGEAEAELMRANTALLMPTTLPTSLVVNSNNNWTGKRRRRSTTTTTSNSNGGFGMITDNNNNKKDSSRGGRRTLGAGEQNKKVAEDTASKAEESTTRSVLPARSDGTVTEPARTEIIKAYAQVVQRDGIVRIDNVLPDDVADSLKRYLVDLRARATHAVEQGHVDSSQERFADVLLNQNRCDLKIPLGPDPVHQALYHLLCRSPVGTLIEHVFGSHRHTTMYDVTTTKNQHPHHHHQQDKNDHRHFGGQAELYELNCFMSNAGARRQLVHADNVCVEKGVLPDDEPVMLTAFVALQDIDERMGPTTWLLGTNNRAAHEQFYSNQKEYLLQSSNKVIGCLPKGACALFDPRTLHCGGANTSLDVNSTRALFYISFKHPLVDYPGCPTCSGYGIADAGFTLDELRTELTQQMEQKVLSTRLVFASSFP